MQKEKITAIVLAGGSGKRMGTACKKQYLELGGRPILFYSLNTFQESCIDEIILVSNESEYCQKEIVQKYSLNKVVKIVPGGKERADSVYQGLLAAQGCSYVLIQDGARPFLTQDMIQASVSAVKKYQACVVGMPVKDTIKTADSDNFANETLARDRVWQIQTPQTFSYPLIKKAYENIMLKQPAGITDDAMVVEYGQFAKIKLIQGSYQNIKITTSEDLDVAEVFLRKLQTQ